MKKTSNLSVSRVITIRTTIISKNIKKLIALAFLFTGAGFIHETVAMHKEYTKKELAIETKEINIFKKWAKLSSTRIENLQTICQSTFKKLHKASLLHIAAYNHDHEILKIMFKWMPYDINVIDVESGSTPIFYAIREKSRVEIEEENELRRKITVQLLIDNGANVNIINNDGSTPLFLAVQYGLTEIVQLLIDSGANVNHKSSLLHTAAYKNDHKMLKILLKWKPYDINVIDEVSGSTPLFYAIQSRGRGLKQKITVQILIDGGANINFVKDSGNSPLISAAHEGLVEIVQLLIDSGANVNFVNKKEHLFTSCRSGMQKIFRSLDG